MHSETALGVIPAGSGNGFAANLNLPLRTDLAVKLLKEPVYKYIDIGKVDDHIFTCSCGIGWEAVIATLFEGSKIRGPLPYATIAISTFLQFEPQEIEIETEPDGWKYRGRPMLFTIANMSEYAYGATIAPDAKEDDGLLDICILPRHGLLNTVKYTPELFRKRIDTIPGFISRLASKITLHRAIAGNIHVDGTPISAGKDIEIEVLKSSLKVAVKNH